MLAEAQPVLEALWAGGSRAWQVPEQRVRAIGPLLIGVTQPGGGGQVSDGGAGQQRGQLAGGGEGVAGAEAGVAANAGVPAVESLGQKVAGAEGSAVLHVAAGLAGGGVEAVTAGPLLDRPVLVHVLHHGAGGEGGLVMLGVWRHQGAGGGPGDGGLLPTWAVLRLGSHVAKLVLNPNL